MDTPPTVHPVRSLFLACLFAAGMLGPLHYPQPAAAQQRCAVVEVFVSGEGQSERSQAARRFAQETYANRPGVILVVRDVAASERALDRYWKLMDHFKVENPGLPAFYVSGRIETGWDPVVTPARIAEALTVEAFLRDGCPRCQAAHPIIFQQLASHYPGYRFVEREITRSTEASRRLQQLAQRYRVQATSVPAIHMCGRLMVGFIDARTSHRQWDEVLQAVTVPCPGGATGEPDRRSSTTGPGSPPISVDLSRTAAAAFGQIVSELPPPQAEPAPPPAPFDGAASSEVATDPEAVDAGSGSPAPDAASNAAPAADAPPARRPAASSPHSNTATLDDDESLVTPPLPSSVDDDTVTLPVIGDIRWRDWGLPAFTLLVGLIDGFNPCAMWVLLFLLSVLVNLQDRWKILAVAGTFVVISGLAYLAFMAAWLNVFQLIGLLRPAQIFLGLLGMTVGLIHIKDFFAFKRGVSLSIPESVKPGLYERVRRIVLAESLMSAILGASVLAVLVNIVELLCTAGLPAMYTGILTMQELSSWQNYAYLLLYIAAYMFDDALMVAIVVVALGRHKLQERGGRILKLISGLVIVALGAIMVFRPEWLS